MLEDSLPLLIIHLNLTNGLHEAAAQTEVVVISTPVGDLSHQRDHQMKLNVRDWHYMRGCKGY